MTDRIVLNEEDVPGAKLMKDPSACSIEELKRWLEYHGLKKSGKKNELVERGAWHLCDISLVRKLSDK